MPCIVPPPIAIEATVTVSQDLAQTFHARGASAAFINSKGDLLFKCFHHPIVVSFRIGTPGVSFDDESLSFADNRFRQRPERLPAKHHQFPIGIQHLGPRRIWFVYSNHRDCGVGDDAPRCPKSEYVLNLRTTRHRVVHVDPVIQNGGSKIY